MIRTGKTGKPSRTQRRPGRNFRKRILAGFRALGHGVDARAARAQVHAFYRSGGAEWTRCLD
ncbi:MAG TPA: hypothetical protein VF203_11675 [Burkholderiales bacterium]